MRAKAGHLRIVNRRSLTPLGIPVLDAIRERAHNEGMTLSELDVLAGTKAYFQSSGRHLTWKHIAAGVELLGGKLMPVWDDEEEDAGALLPVEIKRAA